MRERPEKRRVEVKIPIKITKINDFPPVVSVGLSFPEAMREMASREDAETLMSIADEMEAWTVFFDRNDET